MRDEARRLSRLLREAADDLDWYDTGVKVVRGIALTAAVIGGGVAVAGAFAVSGPMLLLANRGCQVATAGTAVAGGAKLVMHLIEWKKYSEMEKLWEAFRGRMKAMIDPTLSATQYIKLVMGTRCIDDYRNSTKFHDLYQLWLNDGSPKLLKKEIATELSAMKYGLLFSFALSLADFVSLIVEVGQGKGSGVARLLRNYADMLDTLYP